MDFYSIFAELCRNKGLSESQIAKECGLSSAIIPKWKAGAKPRNESIKKLADYFQVSPSYLIGMESTPQPKSNTELSEVEKLIIQRYRQEVEMQKAVKKLLDIE